MKNLLLSIICLLFSIQLFSQDILFIKGQKDSISVKVLEINPEDLKYKKFSNISGPTYSIERAKIEKVIYSNGETEYFSKNRGENLEFATIYVIRPKVNGSWVNGMKILEDEKLIGILSSNTFLKWKTFNVDQEVEIISSAEGSYKLTIIPVSGKTYYFKQDQKTGWVRARPTLELIDENEALKLLKKCELGEQRLIDE